MQALISAPVAQPDRAPGFEPGGRGFDPLRAYQQYQGFASRREAFFDAHRSLSRLSGLFSI
jgi:hypothetical protein